MPYVAEKPGSIAAKYNGLRLIEGKAILEIRPQTGWNKGSAIESCLTRLNLTPADAVYIADDDTEEAGFRSPAEGLSLRVGDGKETAAQSRPGSQEAAVDFLFCPPSARISARRVPSWANSRRACERSADSRHSDRRPL
jgi:trehalose-phosphatase